MYYKPVSSALFTKIKSAVDRARGMGIESGHFSFERRFLKSFRPEKISEIYVTVFKKEAFALPRCVCAVFDHSEAYLKRLSGYMKKKNNLPFALFVFTEREALKEFLKKRRVDLLLLPEDADKDPGMYEILNAKDPNMQTAVLGDKANAASGRQYVDKYQSAEGIISEITELLARSGNLDGMAQAALRRPPVTGIYSFGHSDKAVNFAIDLIRNGSGHKKALYINLTRFSGLEEWLEEPQRASISEVIYYFGSGSEKIRVAYSSARGRIADADVLTAPQNLEDLDLLEDRWEEFFDRLTDVAGAQRVILDMGEAFRDLIKGFDICSSIYLIFDPAKDRMRLAELKTYLSECGREDLLETITETESGRIS